MNKKPTVPAPSKLNLLRQICNFIPEFLVAKIARETKADEKARTFSPWSHVGALVYAQLTHSIGLNDVCDALRLQSGPLPFIKIGRLVWFDVARVREALGAQRSANYGVAQ